RKFSTRNTDRGIPRRKPSEQTARATDGKASRRRRNRRWVTQWGPTGITDKRPERCFPGLRSGFSERDAPIRLLEFPKRIAPGSASHDIRRLFSGGGDDATRHRARVFGSRTG